MLRGGTDTWIAGTYDPDLNTTYWGVAQAKPWMRASRKTYGASVLYSNVDAGARSRYRQAQMVLPAYPGESLDLDEVFERVLIDHGDQKTLMTIGKHGILWKLDRVNGKFLAAKETLFQNVFTKIDPKTGAGHLSPGHRRPEDQRVDRRPAPARKAAMTGRPPATTSPTIS